MAMIWCYKQYGMVLVPNPTSDAIQIPMCLIHQRESELTRVLTKEMISRMKFQLKSRYGQITAIDLNKKLEILNGHVRYLAARELGWTTILCRIYS